MFELTENGLKVAIDPATLDSVWKAVLSWGWMVAGGLVLLAGVWRLMRSRIQRARAYAKEHPGRLSKIVYGVTVASIVIGGATWAISTGFKASAAAKEKSLPGAWSVLYDEIKSLNKSETKLIAIETFIGSTDSQNLPPLPFDGFTQLLENTCDCGYSLELNKLRDLLGPFVQVATP